MAGWVSEHGEHPRTGWDFRSCPVGGLTGPSRRIKVEPVETPAVPPAKPAREPARREPARREPRRRREREKTPA